MPKSRWLWTVVLCLAPAAPLFAQGRPVPAFSKSAGIGPAAGQPIDAAYTARIRQYTTEPYFTSPLVNYLPSAPGIPTPEAALGVIAGAPNVLPTAEIVCKYFRMLAAATPRVRVYVIGHSAEGSPSLPIRAASP
jgi:hypothetical protein